MNVIERACNQMPGNVLGVRNIVIERAVMGAGLADFDGNSAALSLEELMSVPYRIEAFTTQDPDGNWVRHAAYPELPGCEAQAPTIEAALLALERRRLETIAALVRSGRLPPIPRPPLRGTDPAGLAAELGLSHLLGPKR